jgi:hypothetical protein
LSSGFLPSQIAGLELWYDAADLSTITASSGAVSQWNDKSGFGRNLTQGSGALQPTTGIQTINGRNVLDFDADRLVSSNTTITHRTVFIVAESKGAPTTQGALWRHDGGNSTIFRHNGTTENALRFFTRGTSFDATSVTGLTAPHVLAARFSDAVNVIIRRNGTTLTTISTALSQQAATAAVLVGADAGGERFRGNIAEMISYSGSLTDNDLGRVEAYLGAKWGIRV